MFRILRLLNNRQLEGLKETWWNRNVNRKYCGADDEYTGGISIEDIGGVFIVIFSGILIALITLAAEYWYYKNKANSNSSKVGTTEVKKMAE